MASAAIDLFEGLACRFTSGTAHKGLVGEYAAIVSADDRLECHGDLEAGVRAFGAGSATGAPLICYYLASKID